MLIPLFKKIKSVYIANNRICLFDLFDLRHLRRGWLHLDCKDKHFQNLVLLNFRILRKWKCLYDTLKCHQYDKLYISIRARARACLLSLSSNLCSALLCSALFVPNRLQFFVPLSNFSNLSISQLIANCNRFCIYKSKQKLTHLPLPPYLCLLCSLL